MMRLAATRTSTPSNRKSTFRPTSAFSTAPQAAAGKPSVPSVPLLNGYTMPSLGLGTWKSQPNEVAKAVEHAIINGYRHIDCAAIYKNEREVGLGIKEALAKTGLQRSDIFVTSKLWNTEHHPDRVKTACEQSLHDLGLDYLDMYLIHWPVSQLPPETGTIVAGDPAAEDIPLWETFEAMKLLTDEGLSHGIGVSNFNISQIQDIIDDCSLVPQVNQVEIHPYLSQEQLVAYCQSKGIVVTAYSPLGMNVSPKEDRGLPKLTENPVIKEIAARYSKTSSQILIRWSIQRSLVFDFELKEEDMKLIGGLNKNARLLKPAFYSFAD